MPEYAYFNHSIHVGKGIGCASCHGDVSNGMMPFVSPHCGAEHSPEIRDLKHVQESE